jgi:hypothetical protein
MFLAWSIRDVLTTATKELWLFWVSIDLGNETSSCERSWEWLDRLVVLGCLK